MHSIRTLLIAFALVLGGSNLAKAQYWSTDGWSSFKIWRVYGGHSVADASSCIFERYGAVINGCKYNVGLTFDMPLYNAPIGLDATVVVAARATSAITCHLDAFGQPGASAGWYESTWQTATVTNAAQLTLATPQGIYAAGVYCDNIPPGSGVGLIKWPGP